MTYPGSFLRLVLSGPLFTAEEWSFGLSLVPEGGGGGSAPAEVPAALVTACTTFVSAVAGNRARLDTVKLNEIGPDGRYTRDQTVLHEYVPPVGGNVAGYHAPQVALAVTLETGVRRGLAARGRFYIPDPRYSMQTDGRLSVADATTDATAATTFIDAINAAVDGYRVGVASDIGAGRFREVQRDRVGR